MHVAITAATAVVMKPIFTTRSRIIYSIPSHFPKTSCDPHNATRSLIVEKVNTSASNHREGFCALPPTICCRSLSATSIRRLSCRQCTSTRPSFAASNALSPESCWCRNRVVCTVAKSRESYWRLFPSYVYLHDRFLLFCQCRLRLIDLKFIKKKVFVDRVNRHQSAK